MAELNFGLLTPPGSQSIGNAFTQGMDQAQESRARDLQMQQSVRQGQISEMQLQKTQRDEAALAKFYAHIAENGGPTNPVEIEDRMIGSGIPQVANTGLAARMKRLGVEQERARDYEAMFGAPPPGAAPRAAGAPTTAAIPAPAQAPTPAQTPAPVNNLAPAAAPAAPAQTPEPVNSLAPVAAPAAPPAVNTLDRDAAIKTARLKMLSKNPGVVAAGRIELQQLMNPSMHTVDGQLVAMNPDGTPRVVFGEKKQLPIVELQALLATMPPNDPRRPALQAEVEKALTMQNQGAGRLSVSRAGLALRNRESDPFGMNSPITAGGAPMNALPAQPRPTVNALPAQVSGAAPVAPVAPAGAARKMTVADAFQNNVTGPEFVAVLPPTVKPLVESILRYDQRPPSAATKRGQQILELVNQADPTYDAGKAQTRYIAKQTFVKGPVADSIASSNTAIDHMDTLAKYGADLNNTDVRLVNAAKQGIAAAFGANAPTTFDATRRIVGQEVVKAVVANGGSMREREEAADAFSRANSPAQLAGVIKSYQALLSGRLKSTQLRYENDTGLTDFQTKLTPATIRALNSGAATPAAAYVETKTLPDGRVVGKKADGSLEVVK